MKAILHYNNNLWLKIINIFYFRLSSYSVYLNLYSFNLNVGLQWWGLLIIWTLVSRKLIDLGIIALKNIKRPHIFLWGHLWRSKRTIMRLYIIKNNHGSFNLALIALPYESVHVRARWCTRHGPNLYLPMSVFILILHLKDMGYKLGKLVWLWLDATTALWTLLDRDLAWATLWLVAANAFHLMSYCHRALRIPFSLHYSFNFL